MTVNYAPSRDEALELVEAAVRAPSADNQHHVRFQVHAHGLRIWADDFYLRCPERHRRLLTLLSFGAVVENLRLALTGRGYAFSPAWFPDTADPALVIDLAWTDLVAAVPDPLAAAIVTRHTNRRFYKGPKLTSVETAAIEAAMGGAPGARLEWCDAPDRRRTLLALIRRAETERFSSRPLHAELFESIDFTVGWNATTTNRLSPATLEVEPVMRIPFAAFRRWSVMQAAMRVGAHHMLGMRAGDLPARLSPHLCVLTSTLPADQAALEIGVAFQRVWLAAERAGLALQPMVASAILATQTHSREGVSDETRAFLLQGWKTLVGDALPLVVFRLGRARHPKFVAGRRPVADYLD